MAMPDPMPLPITPDSPTSVVAVERCQIPHHCDMPDCDGRGVQFAIDLRHGWTLGHYCDIHSVEDIQQQWRETLEVDAPRVVDMPGEALTHLFEMLGASVVDATPAPENDKPEVEEDE